MFIGKYTSTIHGSYGIETNIYTWLFQVPGVEADQGSHVSDLKVAIR